MQISRRGMMAAVAAFAMTPVAALTQSPPKLAYLIEFEKLPLGACAWWRGSKASIPDGWRICESPGKKNYVFDGTPQSLENHEKLMEQLVEYACDCSKPLFHNA